MKFLVLGATGRVGSNVVRELKSRRQQVRALSRHADKARALGADEIVSGDILDPAIARTAFAGVDGAFILNPVSQTETAEGLMAVSGAMDAGVKRLAYLSVHHVDRSPELPHFGSKLGIEAAVRASGARWTILRPNNFHQNDELFRETMLQYGVYPQPLGGVGVSRVDVRDIAELAAVALTSDSQGDTSYDVVGPRPVTGPETAAIWSRALGKPIAYGGDDLERWEQQSLQFMPAWMVYDFKLMYRQFQRNGLRGTDADVATLTRVLGHPPRSLETFATECAKAWSTEAAATPR